MPTSNLRGSSPREKQIRTADVTLFNRVIGQLEGLKAEFTVLSKSKPDSPLNELKVTIVNERLKDANQLLTGDHKPFASFMEFTSENLPSNSDVLIVLAQYITALEQWRSAHTYESAISGWCWRTEDGDLEVDQAKRSRY